MIRIFITFRMFRKTDLTTLFFIQGNVASSLSCICIKLMCNVKINHKKSISIHVVIIVCFRVSLEKYYVWV